MKINLNSLSWDEDGEIKFKKPKKKKKLPKHKEPKDNPKEK